MSTTPDVGVVFDADGFPDPWPTRLDPWVRGTPKPHRIVRLVEGEPVDDAHGFFWAGRGVWAVPLDDTGKDAGPMRFFAWEWGAR